MGFVPALLKGMDPLGYGNRVGPGGPKFGCHWSVVRMPRTSQRAENILQTPTLAARPSHSCTCFALEASQVRECDYWVLLSQLSRITAGDLGDLGELEGPRY